METNKEIQNKIDSTMDAMNAVETVNVSPFFKDQTMQRLFAEKEETANGWNWFTPKIQLATLVCVVILNVAAFTQMDNTSSYDENISQLAETYGMSTSTETSILN